MDLFTRWTEAHPLRITTTKAVSTVLEREIFARYGYPKAILSDNGPQFVSRAFTRNCRTLGVLRWTTRRKAPQKDETKN